MADIVPLVREAPHGLVDSSRQGGVLTLTLTRPPANALSLAMMDALQAELDRGAADAEVRVIVLAGTGKVFCAGHDLKEMQAHRGDEDGGEGFFARTFDTCSRLMQTILDMPKPVVAAVDGIATAAGCQLVATCDLAIASDRATFGVNGIDVGLFCTTPGVALARTIAPKHAMEMLLTGEMVDAATAREFGLVNRVVPPEYLTQVVNKYAQVIAAKSPAAIRFGKQAFRVQRELSVADAYDHASRVMVENMMDADAAEGIDAFIGKRKAEWRTS